MSKNIIIVKDSLGNKQYFGMTSSEIEKANLFLEDLLVGTESLYDTLDWGAKEKLLNNRFEIGKYLDSEIKKWGIDPNAYSYLWQEVSCWAPNNLNTTKDRSERRGFFLYCYKLYEMGEDALPMYTWREWSEIFDRKFTAKHKSFLLSLAQLKKKYKVKQNEFRLIMFISNKYFKKYDFSVYNNEELETKVSLMIQMAQTWLAYINNLKDKRQIKRIEKSKGDYVQRAMKETKFAEKEQWKDILESIINSYLS